MAQDVTIAGASYEDVPGIQVPKTGGGTSSFYDVSDTTATAADVAQGKTFHLASGAAAVGTASGGGSGVSVFYGTCATAAATAAKVVVCDDFTSVDLVEGTVINVKFTYAQTYNGAPTLNVNSTGAKNVKRVGTTNAARYEWVAGEVLQFVYDGTYWVLADGGIATTTYYGVTKLSSATNSTSTALAATASAVKVAYDLASGKQDALTAGTGIDITNNVISATSAAVAWEDVTSKPFSDAAGTLLYGIVQTGPLTSIQSTPPDYYFAISSDSEMTSAMESLADGTDYAVHFSGVLTLASCTVDSTYVTLVPKSASNFVSVQYHRNYDWLRVHVGTEPVTPATGRAFALYEAKTGGVINSDAIPPATASALGGVKVGSGLSITSDGTLSAPPATASTLGGVKVGSGLSVTSDGTLSASGGGGSSWTDISSGYAAGLIAANETDMFDQLDIVAYTNGQLVYLSGEISRTSANTMTLPSGYEATGYAAGGALDLDSGAPATCYITSFTDYNGFDAVDANMAACEHFTFTIIYPIA